MGRSLKKNKRYSLHAKNDPTTMLFTEIKLLSKKQTIKSLCIHHLKTTLLFYFNTMFFIDLHSELGPNFNSILTPSFEGNDSRFAYLLFFIRNLGALCNNYFYPVFETLIYSLILNIFSDLNCLNLDLRGEIASLPCSTKQTVFLPATSNLDRGNLSLRKSIYFGH
jgi:hypothetical protein